MAVGLTVAEDMIEPAMARLSELLARQGADRLGAADLRVDGVMMPGAASPELVEQIEAAGPFGADAPTPRYVFADMQIFHARIVGGSHLKISFGDGMGPRLDAIAFGAMEEPIGTALRDHGGARFHLAGRVELNTWRGRSSAQLRLEDAART